MTHEIIRSLETIQDQVKQELQNVRTYRAFLAVGQAIEEISEVEEIVRALNGIRGQVVERLHDVREYRALLAVQKSVEDISEVLGILEESSRKRAEAAAGNGAAATPAAEVADGSKIATAPAAAASSAEAVAAAHAPAASGAIMMDHTNEAVQPTESTGETVPAVSTAVAHEGDATSPSVMDAVGHSPFLSSTATTDQTHGQHLPLEPSSDAETVEIAAAIAAHLADAASHSEMDAVAPPPAPPTTDMAEPVHEQQPPLEPARETAEHAAESAVHEGSETEPEDIGIAKVA
jgi:hypothetical protein